MATELEFVTSMVERYRALLTKAAGMQSVTMDGQIIALRDLESGYERWSRKLARLNGTRPLLAGIQLGYGDSSTTQSG